MQTAKVGIREFRADLAGFIASSTPVAVTRHGQTVGYFIPTQGEQTNALATLHQAGQVLLASVGAVSPFVGLFGTVWGVYHALLAIGATGAGTLDKVAGPVGEALIMTAFGLAVAVPAVMGYNWLIRRNKTVMERVRAFSGDVHNVLLAGKR